MMRTKTNHKHINADKYTKATKKCCSHTNNVEANITNHKTIFKKRSGKALISTPPKKIDASLRHKT